MTKAGKIQAAAAAAWGVAALLTGSVWFGVVAIAFVVAVFAGRKGTGR